MHSSISRMQMLIHYAERPSLVLGATSCLSKQDIESLKYICMRLENDAALIEALGKEKCLSPETYKLWHTSRQLLNTDPTGKETT